MTETNSSQLLYRRVLIKLSGEALGEQGFDNERFGEVITELISLVEQGVQVALVMGGGNFLRGDRFASQYIDRVTADQVGMLATVMNGLALRHALQTRGLTAPVYSALDISGLVEPYNHHEVKDALNKHKMAILTGGVGEPLFSTDSGAALRSVELQADILLKASTIDGVYSADPRIDASAQRYEHLTFDEVLAHKLNVMDLSAICLCQEHNMPIRVFATHQLPQLKNLVLGDPLGTLISRSKDE